MYVIYYYFSPFFNGRRRLGTLDLASIREILSLTLPGVGRTTFDSSWAILFRTLPLSAPFGEFGGSDVVVSGEVSCVEATSSNVGSGDVSLRAEGFGDNAFGEEGFSDNGFGDKGLGEEGLDDEGTDSSSNDDLDDTIDSKEDDEVCDDKGFGDNGTDSAGSNDSSGDTTDSKEDDEICEDSGFGDKGLGDSDISNVSGISPISGSNLSEVGDGFTEEDSVETDGESFLPCFDFLPPASTFNINCGEKKISENYYTSSIRIALQFILMKN